MEESEKISGKKKLPAIPSNYVSLLQLQERWVKEQERKQKGKEDNAETQRGQEENEKQVEERVDAVRRSREQGHFIGRDRKNGKPKEQGIDAGLAVNEIKGVEKEKEGEKLKNKKKWKSKRKDKKDERARAENDGEEVVKPAANEPLPASVENNKREEEVVRDEAHAPEQASGEARRDWRPRSTARTEDRTTEIRQRFRAVSMKGDIRTGDYCRYGGRQNGYSNHGGGNNRKFDRRKEPNQRNEGMVWVKKGEVSDGNVGGIQSSSSSSKELD